MDRVILHADVNNFYASVAIRNNEYLQNKPVVICGDTDKRHGIVLAKSNLAKKAGIKTGDTLGMAYKLCSDLICLPPDYKEYTTTSNLIYNIYKRFTPLVESFGLDECWLDVTGTLSQYDNNPMLIANIIKDTVKSEIGVTISIGVSFTKVFAKLGSDLKKPDAITLIDKNNYKKIAWALPVENMLFIGEKIRIKLREDGIKTIGDLAKANAKELIKKFGKIGERLYEYANGLDKEEVGTYYNFNFPESISNGTTAQEDITNDKNAQSMVYSLAEVIAFRLRKYCLLANGVGIYARNTEFEGFNKQQKLKEPTSDARIIGEVAFDLLRKNCCISEGNPIRQITVATYDFVEEETIHQNTIFDSKEYKNLITNKKLDKIRQKYGFGVLKKAIELDDVFICDAKEIDDDFLPFDKSKNVRNETKD